MLEGSPTSCSHVLVPENTNLLCKGKYHSTDDILFPGFDWTKQAILLIILYNKAAESKPTYLGTMIHSECSLLVLLVMV